MPKEQYHHGDLKNALIKAGTELLFEEGIGSFSLRKVASRAGVSHSAPYAHFTDKQSLIAAISTEGFQQLYTRLEKVMALYRDNPARLLFETAYAYLQFASDSPAHFKIMFSGILEQEKEYPDYVRMSYQTFDLLVEIARRCQEAGVLKPGPSEIVAISTWSLVHGYIALLLERQISRRVLEAHSQKELLCQLLNQVTLVQIQAE